MPIKIICPGCEKSHNAPDKYAGKKVTCTKCKASILVPGKVVE